MTTFNTGLNKMFNYAFNGWRDGAVGLVPTKDLNLLIDPGATLGVGLGNKEKRELLGPNLLSNGDFHDFTMDDDANVIGHYILDETYVEEDGNESICSERTGSEVSKLDNQFTTTVEGWDGASGTTIAHNSAGYITGTGGTAIWVQKTGAFTLTAGRQYRVQWKCRTSQAQVDLSLRVGSDIDKVYDNLTADGEWHEYDEILTLSYNANYVYFYKSASSQTIDVDYLTITELPESSLEPKNFSLNFEDEYADGNTLGSDIVNNGDFSLDTGWNGSTWSIANGVATHDGTAGTQNLYQSSQIRIGRSYRCVFDIVSVTAGGCRCNLGGSKSGTTRTTVGTHTEDLDIVTGNDRVYIQAQSSFVGSIDNIKVYEIYPESPVYKNGGVVGFDGVDQYLDGGDILDMGTDNWTCEAWIKVADASPAGAEVFVGRYEDTNNRWTLLLNTDGQLRFICKDGGTNRYYANTTGLSLTINTWYHVAVVLDRGVSIQFYVNGVAFTTDEITNTAFDLTNAGYFGIGGNGDNSFFTGDIAEVRISDVARSASDIMRSYAIAKRWYGYVNATSLHENDNWAQKMGRSTGSGIIKTVDLDGSAPLSLNNDSVYKISLDVVDTEYATSDIDIYFEGIDDYNDLANDVSVGTYFMYRTGAHIGSYFSIYSTTLDHEITIDNVKLEEVLNADTLTDGFVEDFSQGGAEFGENIISNGDFHDFTMEDDANTFHWILDKSYSAEDGLDHIVSERSGSESVTIDESFNAVGDWQLINSTISSGALHSGGGATDAAVLLTPLTADKMYLVEYEITGYADLGAGSGLVTVGTNTFALGTAVGTYQQVILSDDTLFGFAFTSIDVDIPWCKVTELPDTSLIPINFSDDFNTEYIESDSPVYQNGGSLSFDGSTQSLVGGNICDFGTNDDFSVELWLKYSDLGGVDIVGKMPTDAANTGYRFLIISTGEVYFRISDDIAASNIQSDTVLDDGAWHHIAAVIDRAADTLDLYVDGILDAVQVDISSIGDSSNSSNFVIGRSPYSETRHFEGQIAEVRVSDVARTAEEIYQSFGKAKDWVVSGVSDVLLNDNWSQRFSQVGSGSRINQSFDTVDKQIYRMDMDAYHAGGVYYGQIRDESNNALVRTDNFGITTFTTYTNYFVGNGNTYTLRAVSSSPAGYAVIDNMRIRAVTNGNHGYMINDMGDDQPQHPFALVFDGVDQSISHGDNVDIGTEDFILWGWFKKRVDDAGQPLITKRETDVTTNIGYQWYLSSGNRISFALSDGDVRDLVESNGDALLIADGWTFLSVVIDRDTLGYIYKNGVKLTLLSEAVIDHQASLANTEDLRIGLNDVVQYLDAKMGITGIYIFQNGLPSNYETAIIKTIYDNTKGYYEDE